MRKVATQLPPDSSICAQCSNLDLLGALQKASQIRQHEVVLFGTDLYFGIHIANVGHRFRQLPSTECSLCSILFNSRVITAQGHAISDGGDELRLIGFLDWSGLIRFPLQHREYDSTYLAVVPSHFGSDRIDDSKLLRNHVSNQGAAILLRDGGHPAMFSAREVPDDFDADKVNTWMQYCKSNHSILCGGSKGPAIPGLRLIDCATLSVEEAASNNSYVALSYVWGNPGDVDTKLRSTNNGLLLPETLSAVITDTISVAKALGFRYLWVDKFCIDQDDPDAKHQQVQQMNIIYENADLTIVAAAGTDETYGLPGVGQVPRTPQRTARFNGLRIVSTMTDPHASIQSSRWSSRGWTFQEAVLSRRCLFFTDQQIYFECDSMNCFESLYSPLDKLHTEDRSRSLDGLRAGTFVKSTTTRGFWDGIPDEDDPLKVFEHYLSAIQSYSSRHLRYDSDSLNAFQGIIQRYSEFQKPFNAIWGVPYPAQEEERAAYFRCALTWCHASQSNWKKSTEPRRRPEFPSWTWAGWEGAVRIFQYVLETRREVNGVQPVRFGGHGIDEEDLDSLDFATPDARYRVLRLLAKAVSPSLFSYNATADGKTSWTFRKDTAELYPSQECMLEAQFAQELMDVGRWRCVWVYSVRSISFVMVLKMNHDTGNWTRAGMFHVYCLYEPATRDVEAAWFNIE